MQRHESTAWLSTDVLACRQCDALIAFSRPTFVPPKNAVPPKKKEKEERFLYTIPSRRFPAGNLSSFVM